LATSLTLSGTALIGSTSTTVGEIVAPVPATEVSTPSAVCREEPALVSVMGGEVVTPSATPRVGVAVRASSTSASPATCGSGDLVREGDAGITGTPCGLATGLHGKIPRQDCVQIKSINIASALKSIPRRSRKPSLGQNTRGLIAAGIFARAAAALRCASKPRRRASSNIFCTSSRCLLAVGLSGLSAA
jgi:hypothetical protein